MKKRVIITGAGASKSFCSDFGIGSELLENILNRIDEDHLPQSERYLTNIIDDFADKVTEDRLKEIGLRFRSIRQDFARILRSYLNEKGISIDDFLYRNNSVSPVYKDLAMFCIAFHIAGYEGASIGKFKYCGNWLSELSNLLIDVHNRESNLDSIEIVTFNYDRLIENYIDGYFRDHGLHSRIRTFLETNVFHVYGSLGKLPWQSISKLSTVNYGANNSDREVMEAASKNFITMFEDREQGNYGQIQDKINSADELWILGFGFDEMNIERLGIQNFSGDIFFTSYSPEEAMRIKAKLEGYKFKNFDGSNSCRELISFMKSSHY